MAKLGKKPDFYEALRIATVSSNALTGYSATSSQHNLVGAIHIASGLVIGPPAQYLKALSATTFGFATIPALDIPDLSATYLTPGAHTAIGDSAPHHAAISLAASAAVLLDLSGQALSLDTQTANYVFAGPTSGGAVAPTFRALVAADIPAAAPAAHVLDGALHTVSGRTAGELLTATGAATFGWGAGANVTLEPTGFSDPSAVVVNYAAKKITLTGTWKAYWRGQEVVALTTGWVSAEHDATLDSTFFLYYDGANFAWSENAFPGFDKLRIAIVNYGTTYKFAMRECHGIMAWQTQEAFHETIGARRESGGTLAGYTLASTTAAERRPSVSQCVIADEDCPTTNLALADNGPYSIMFLLNASLTEYTIDYAEIVPVLAARPYYNSFSTPNWVQTLMPANSVATVWLLEMPASADATSQKYRHTWIQPQWITQAQSGAANHMAAALALELQRLPSELNLGTLNTTLPEFVPIARLVIQYTGGDWSIASVTNLIGTRYALVGSPAGNFLANVTTDATLTGVGTVASLLSAVALQTLTPPAVNVLTLTATAASTLGLAITAGKTLTLTSVDDYNLTIASTLTLNALPIGGLAVATAANTLGSLVVGLTTQILVGGGAATVPVWGTDLPTAVTIGSAYIYRAAGTDVAVADGGTNLSSYAIGDILYASAATTIGKLADVAAGQPLLSGGVATAPAYAGWYLTGVTAGKTLTFTATENSGITFPAAGAVLTIPTAGAVMAALLGTANAFTLDNTINGLTVGRGGGNYAENVALGTNAGTSNTGQYCSAIGYAALESNTGAYCSAMGVSALYQNTGVGCSAMGVYTLYRNTGVYCSAIGYYALYQNTGANCNAMGVNAGRYIANGITVRTTGDGGLFLGGNTRALALAENNQIVIGDSAIGAGANSATLGNTSITTTVLRSQLKLMKGAGYMTADVVEATGVTTLTTSPAGGFVITPPVTFTGALTANGGIVMADGATIGQAAGPLVAFDDTNNYLEITGCNVGIGTTAPLAKLDVRGQSMFSYGVAQIGNSGFAIPTFIGADPRASIWFGATNNNQSWYLGAYNNDTLANTPFGLYTLNHNVWAQTWDQTDGSSTFHSNVTVGGAFGCNTKAAQGAYASGGAVAYTAGTDHVNDARLQLLYTLVANIRSSLVANGIMS